MRLRSNAAKVLFYLVKKMRFATDYSRTGDMELVEEEDIRDVLMDAKEQATDKKQQQILAQLLDELDTGSLGKLSNT